jgi:5-methylcytosine-specific restriction endonuclease McrA
MQCHYVFVCGDDLSDRPGAIKRLYGQHVQMLPAADIPRSGVQGRCLVQDDGLPNEGRPKGRRTSASTLARCFDLKPRAGNEEKGCVTMSGRLTKTLRSNATRAQRGLCYYCKYPMRTPDDRADAVSQVSGRGSRWFDCTAEHLTPRSEGGQNTVTNIVAACRFCNSQRHRRKVILSPRQFRAHVRRRLASGRWHTKLYLSSRDTFPPAPAPRASPIRWRR